jgi:PAS domain S-box-containing protein
MGEALLAVDGAGRVTLSNPAARSLLGIAGARPVGRSVDEVLSEPPRAVALLAAIGGPERSGAASARALLPDGQRIVAATAAPLTDEQGRQGRVYVLRDVTAEVNAERLRTEIIANVSHELRTPLTPIVGYLELLRGRDVPPPRVKEFAEQGAEAAQRLQGIVEKFIDLADLEAGNTPVEIEVVASRRRRGRPRALAAPPRRGPSGAPRAPRAAAGAGRRPPGRPGARRADRERRRSSRRDRCGCWPSRTTTGGSG